MKDNIRKAEEHIVQVQKQIEIWEHADGLGKKYANQRKEFEVQQQKLETLCENLRKAQNASSTDTNAKALKVKKATFGDRVGKAEILSPELSISADIIEEQNNTMLKANNKSNSETLTCKFAEQKYYIDPIYAFIDNEKKQHEAPLTLLKRRNTSKAEAELAER